LSGRRTVPPLPHFCFFCCETKEGPAGRRPSGSERTKAQLSKNPAVKHNDKAAPQAKRTTTREPKKAQLSKTLTPNKNTLRYRKKKRYQRVTALLTSKNQKN